VNSEASRPGFGLLEVYDWALPQVYGYLMSRCGERWVAEDLTSETFLAAARQAPEGPVSLGWLIGVARHKLPDAAAGRRFYGRVLGWSFGRGQLESAGNQVDGVIPHVGLWPGSAWRRGVTAGAILSWRVDDIAAATELVRAAGGTATETERLPYGLQSECTDGLGLRFWLHQLSPPGEPPGSIGGRQGDISYVVLRVADLRRARELFGSVLGWAFSPVNAGLQVDGPAPMTGVSEGTPGAVLCYQVDDMAAAVERVVEAGGAAGEVRPRPYGLEALCTDNQAVEFYLHQLG
jgi:predicted enzyme related to lactoylglutathione lyase